MPTQRAQNRQEQEDRRRAAEEERDRNAAEQLELLQAQLDDEDFDDLRINMINLHPVLNGQEPAEGTRTQQRLQAQEAQNFNERLHMNEEAAGMALAAMMQTRDGQEQLASIHSRSVAQASAQQSEEGTVNVEGQRNLQEDGRIQASGQRAGNTDSNADMASPSPDRGEFSDLAQQFQNVGRRQAIAFGHTAGR